MTERFFFLSDAHLGSRHDGQDRREEKLIRFCRTIRGASALYLLGDIFDFWFEYGSVVPSAHFRTLCAFRELIEAGTEVHYIGGNHDFWAGDFLTREVGIILHVEPVTVTLAGQQVRLRHGDGFLPGDRFYPLFKRIVRNRCNVALYKLIHPAVGMPLARFVSGRSRRFIDSHINLDKISAAYREEALKRLSTLPEAVLIMGHTHKADMAVIGNKRYINTGNWMTDFDYLSLCDGHYQLERFEGNQS